MSLRINDDTDRVMTLRNVGLASATSAHAMERLTSGYRINRASDDASGLVISEKLRGQVRGLATSQRNAQDAISLVQTAEGALAGVHGMLQRIRELAVQNANGVVSSANASAIQSEVGGLAAEIERVGRATAFNGISLLAGPGAVAFQVGADDGQTISVATVSLAAVLGTGWD